MTIVSRSVACGFRTSLLRYVAAVNGFNPCRQLLLLLLILWWLSCTAWYGAVWYGTSVYGSPHAFVLRLSSNLRTRGRRCALSIIGVLAELHRQ